MVPANGLRNSERSIERILEVDTNGNFLLCTNRNELGVTDEVEKRVTGKIGQFNFAMDLEQKRVIFWWNSETE